MTKIDTSERHDLRPYGRRAFLGTVVLGLSSLGWAEPLWRRSNVGSIVPSELSGVVPGAWRIYTVAATMPAFDRERWRLTVDGEVSRPLQLRYDDLLSLPSAEQTSVFHCVTGWSVSNVRWKGVRFGDLLANAGPSPRAGALVFTSSEKPYVDSLTLEEAMLPDAMLAYEMDGRPLAREHGAPVRVVIPDMYGYKNVKWVERITVARRPVDGYWEQRGYDRDAWVGRSNGYGVA